MSWRVALVSRAGRLGVLWCAGWAAWEAVLSYCPEASPGLPVNRPPWGQPPTQGRLLGRPAPVCQVPAVFLPPSE